MGVFKRNRSRTRAIPDMSRVNIMEDQLKELKNRLWRSLSRALQLEHIRNLAGRVNRWFDKHAPWRRGQRRGRVSPTPHAGDTKDEEKADIRISRDEAQNILILTSCPITSVESNYELDQAERAIIEDILRPDEEFPEVKPRKKVRFEVYEEPDPTDEDSVTKLLKHMNSNKKSTHNKNTTKVKGILKNLGPTQCAAESGDTEVETFKDFVRSPLSPIQEIEENNDNIKVEERFDSDDDIDSAIGDIVRYSRTSMARTLMARLLCLARTHSCVPRGTWSFVNQLEENSDSAKKCELTVVPIRHIKNQYGYKSQSRKRSHQPMITKPPIEIRSHQSMITKPVKVVPTSL